MKLVNRLPTTMATMCPELTTMFTAKYGASVWTLAYRYGKRKGRVVGNKLLLLALCVIVGTMLISCGCPTSTAPLSPASETTHSPLALEPIPTLPSSASVFITPAFTEATSGEEFTVAVEVEPASKGISAGEINLAFEPEAMQIVHVKPGTLLGERPLPGVNIIDNEAGTLSYSSARIGQTKAPTEHATFAVITFQSLEAAKTGNYELKLTSVGLADENFEDVTAIELKGANIEIRP